MKRRTSFLLATVFLMISCTRDPNATVQVVQVPTQASLPTDAPTLAPSATAILTNTPIPPTLTPADTNTTIPTNTAAPTETAIPTSTNTLVPSSTSLPPTLTPFLFPTSLPVLAASGWRFEQEISAFDDTERLTLMLDADTPIHGWLDNPTPTLVLRCDSGELDVYIVTGVQTEVESGLYDQASARVRFDREPPQDIIMNESTTGNALFFTDPRSVIQSMSTHHALLFGFTPYNATFTSTTFSLDGLSEAIVPLITPCALQTVVLDIPPTPGGCSPQDMILASRWAEGMQAVVTPLQNVQVSTEIQNARSAVEALAYPECLATARQYVLNALDESFLSFISSTPNVVQSHADNAIAQMNLFAEEMERVLPGGGNS